MTGTFFPLSQSRLIFSSLANWHGGKDLFSVQVADRASFFPFPSDELGGARSSLFSFSPFIALSLGLPVAKAFLLREIDFLFIFNVRTELVFSLWSPLY